MEGVVTIEQAQGGFVPPSIFRWRVTPTRRCRVLGFSVSYITMTESQLAVRPSGLRGLNRLAIKLNARVANGQISEWHLGRWSDKSQTCHTIQFENESEAIAATLSLEKNDGRRLPS